MVLSRNAMKMGGSRDDYWKTGAEKTRAMIIIERVTGTKIIVGKVSKKV